MKSLIMALNLLYNLYFVTAPDATNFPLWAANTKLKVYWDDSTSLITPKLYNGVEALIDTPVNGPNLTASWIALNTRITEAGFQFCSGTTLNYFTLDLNIFPYGVRHQILNSNTCQTIVCDLELINVATTPATGALNLDGTATVNATSTHTPIKYKLNTSDFDYATDGQLSNIFAGLLPGQYNFAAIDSFRCKKTSVFVIFNADTYTERWKSDFRDQKTGAVHRIAIEDRLFGGTSTAIKMDIAGAQLDWRGEATEDSFDPVVPSVMTASLLSETDGQFSDLFATDERRFKLKKYINTGSGNTLQWVGFVTPMLYGEPYTESNNYSVSVKATDGLGNLSNLPFTNDQGFLFGTRISLMEAIGAILRKTGLQLSIKESVNLFETTMAQTASDSMLTQCTIDPDTYKNSDGEVQDCLTVLKSLISNIGSRLYMDSGIWNIDFVEQKSATSIPYRIFTYLGVYFSNGTYDPTINIGTSMISSRVVPYDASVFMNLTENFGIFKFVNDLHIVNNLLGAGGDMEAIDNTGSNPTFKGWSVDASQGPGISYGLEQLDKPNRNSKFAAFFDFKNTASGVYMVLKSDSFTFATPPQQWRGKLIFDVYIRPVWTDTYVFLDYEVKFGSGYLTNEGNGFDGERTISTVGNALLLDGPTVGPGIAEYNRVYVTDHVTWKTIQIDFKGSTEGALAGAGFVKFRVWGNPWYDYTSLANLQAAVTIDGRLRAEAPKARVFDTPVLRWYTLNQGADATSSPDKLRPTDWSAGDPMFWKLDKTTAIPAAGPNNWVQSILIDNVQLQYLPVGAPIQETIEYAENINLSIINTLNKTFNHGDIPTTDANYKYISKGHLRLTSGTPTIYWKRSYMSTDQMPLVQLLQELYIGQYQQPKFKLSGTWGCDLSVSFANTFYELRTLKRFLPNAMTLNYADSSLAAEMLELKSGVSGPAPDIAEFDLSFGLDHAS